MANKRKDAPKGTRRTRRAVRRVRNLIVVALVVVGTAGIVYYALSPRQGGATAEQAAAATGVLSAAETFHDFGRISMRDGIVTYPFRLRNTGSEPALIRRLYTS